ncbi:MAG: hypothetical protein WD042_13780 [Phycisphaeraceae bacterium]
MSTFAPKLEMLPPSQREVWARPRHVPASFVLYDDTAERMDDSGV